MHTLTYRSVDTMKLNREPSVNGSQLSAERRRSALRALSSMNLTHIAIDPWLDTTAQFIANGHTPGPYNTLEQETQAWVDDIHALGLRVIHRGTWAGCKANFDFPAATHEGDHFVQRGNAEDAPTDGEATYCGKLWRYMTVNVGVDRWRDGDICCPLTEGTEFLATAAYQFFDDTGGATTAYAAFYAELHDVVDLFNATYGKNVKHMSFNNYSEPRSGWLPGSLYADQGLCGIDYYGRHQGSNRNLPRDYIQDIKYLYDNRTSGLPIFQGEWGNIPGEGMPNFPNFQDTMNYLIQFYRRYRDELVETGIVIGFNFWGGWSGQNTSLLYLDDRGEYQLNAHGQILRQFFHGYDMKRVPIIRRGRADALGGRNFAF